MNGYNRTDSINPKNSYACYRIQDNLSAYPENLWKLSGHVVKLNIEDNAKSVAEPPKRIPYHLEGRVEESIAVVLDIMLLKSTLLVSRLHGHQISYNCSQVFYSEL